jgi:DNA uptake protein ComE-like DNA-binding protein
MKRTVIRAILSAVVLALSTSLALAVEVTVTTPDVTGAAKSSVESTRASAKKTAAGAKATVDSTKTGAKAAVAETKASTKGAVTDTKTKTKATVTDTKAGAKAAVADTTAKTRAAAASVKQTIVDINSATEAELRAIPGVGEAYAAKIIAGRPYANKSQLKTRNILPTPVYETVKNQLVAKKAAKGTAPAKKK